MKIKRFQFIPFEIKHITGGHAPWTYNTYDKNLGLQAKHSRKPAV